MDLDTRRDRLQGNRGKTSGKFDNSATICWCGRLAIELQLLLLDGIYSPSHIRQHSWDQYGFPLSNKQELQITSTLFSVVGKETACNQASLTVQA